MFFFKQFQIFQIEAEILLKNWFAFEDLKTS